MTRRSPLLSLLTLEDRSVPAAINFTLTTASSSLTLSGSLDGTAINQQAAGSLTTTYSGNVRTDVDFSSNTIEFVSSGSSMKANNSGTWVPAVGGGSAFIPGSGPANYGGQLTYSGLNTRVAARGMIGVFNSTPLPITGASFPSSQNLVLNAGSTDYHNLVLQGTDTLVGSGGSNAGVNGTFTDNGNGTYSLVMPSKATINDTVNGLPLILNINGTLNATATLPVVDLNGSASGIDSAFSHVVAGASSKIAPGATITRVTAANLASMTVTLGAAPDGAAESLAVDLTGSGLSSTGFNTLTNQLVITGTGSLATYQGVLQKVTYANTNANGTPGARPVIVTVADADNSSLPRTAAGTVIVPAKVSEVKVNEGATQRSRVTSVTVTFNSIVSLPVNPANAFSLTRQPAGTPVTLNAAVDNSGPGTVVNLTFTGGPLNAGSLADGRYTLTAIASQINGGAFDGDGNGTLGDNFVQAGTPANGLFRLFGDVDANGTVDATDFSFFPAFGAAVNSPFDFNNNSDVDSGTDLSEFGNRFGLTL